MQCPSCRFENMPQYTKCVRCGSILSGEDASIGVQPPRAGKLEKRLRISQWIRFFNRVCLGGGKIAGIEITSLFHSRSVQDNLWALAWRAAIPGFPQWYLGMIRHAQVFFFGWLILLLFSLITYGLTISTFLIGLVISFHLSSILNAVIFLCRERSDRIALGFVMLLGAVLLFYVPVYFLLGGYYGLHRVTAAAGSLQNGDSILYTQTGEEFQPQTGQVVLYMAPEITYQAGGNGYGPANNRLFGNMFDRVLAVAGQTVTWKNGQLFVDDQLSSLKPVVSLRNKPPDTTFVVPNGYCHIVPAVAFQQLNMPTNPTDWQSITTVPNHSIYGHIWGIRRSLLHFVDLNAPIPNP